MLVSYTTIPEVLNACSLKVNVLLRFAESPHERRGPVGFHNSFVVYIVVVPGFLESVLQESIKLISLLCEVRSDDLSGKLFSLIFCNEKLFAGQSLLSDSFSGIGLNNVGGEGVDWMIIITV